jgi:hypothetical protein
MSEQHNSEPYPRANCLICDGTEFTWGKVVGQYGLADMSTTVSKFLSNEQAAKIEGDVETVNARKCDRCQNIQLFGISEK